MEGAKFTIGDKVRGWYQEASEMDLGCFAYLRSKDGSIVCNIAER